MENKIKKYILIILVAISTNSCNEDNSLKEKSNYQNLDSLNYIGSKLYFSGKLDSSLIVYDLLIKKDSLNSDYIFERGTVKLAKHDLLGSLADMNKSLRINSKNTQAIYHKALIFEQMTIIDSSNYLFNYLISLKPDSILYISERAKYYERQNNIDLALKDWSKLISLEPKNPEHLNERGVRLLSLEKYEEALIDFNNSIKIAPFEANLVNRSQTYYYLKKYELSLKDIEKALELNSNNPQSYLQRAYIKYHLKNEIGACEDFKKASEMGNKEAETYCKQCLEKGVLKEKPVSTNL